MKRFNLYLMFLVVFAGAMACHGKSNKDYDKGEKNDPATMSVPSNSDATNPGLADTAKAKKDTTTSPNK